MIGLITKAVLAAFVAASSSVITALQNGHIDGLEWIAIASAFVVGLGAVFAIPNLPSGVAKYGKAIAAGIVAGLSAAATAYLNQDISPDEWVVIAVAVLTGLGLVAVAPNAPASVNSLKG